MTPTAKKIIAQRAFIRKSYLSVLENEKQRATAEKIFGEYGSGSKNEVEIIEKSCELQNSAALRYFFETEVFDCEEFKNFLLNDFSVPINKIYDSLNSFSRNFAEMFKSKVFLFEQIPDLDDRSTQRVLREVSDEDLAHALGKPSPEVTEKVSHNMSKKAWEMLEKKAKRAAKLPQEEILRAQDKVARIAMRLIARGDIVFPAD